MEAHSYDTCIVGAGAAGLSAALFACRRGMRTIVVSTDLGGQTASTSEIENYPGLGRVEGPELIELFYREASSYGCEFILDTTVASITEENDVFSINTDSHALLAHTVILTFGKAPRSLGIPGEKEFAHRGIYYSVVSNAGDFFGKRVAVIGGGNSALEASLHLADAGAQVFLIHRRDEFRGEKILVDRLEHADGIQRVTPYIPTEFVGDDHIQALRLTHADTGEEKTITVEAVFPAIGFEPKADFVKDFVACTPSGLISISAAGETSRHGVFAAGDATAVPYQQIVISAGAGATAALSAFFYLAKKRGLRVPRTDWGFRTS